MKNKIKIIIAGIGGVGGYFGGLLAKQFSDSIEVEIYFLARGEHLKQIQDNGLKVLKGDTAFIAKPTLATDNANEIGVVDYILLCTKSYDLEGIIEQLKPCIDNNTALLPFLNGVDSAAKIKSLLPDATVFDGCVYVVSQVKEYGVVENGGNIQKLYFGQENLINEKLSTLENIFKQAQIDATLTKHITSVLWEKFYLVGANSSATSYYNCNKGEILGDTVKRELLHLLLSEIDQVAKASGIYFDRDMISDTIEKIQSFPYETTSSMQRDFERSGTRTELETITGFIVRAGQKFNLPTPTFNQVYEELLHRK